MRAEGCPAVLLPPLDCLSTAGAAAAAAGPGDAADAAAAPAGGPLVVHATPPELVPAAARGVTMRMLSLSAAAGMLRGAMPPAAVWCLSVSTLMCLTAPGKQHSNMWQLRQQLVLQ